MMEFIKSAALLLVLLNPFLLIIYLIDVVEKLNRRQFGKVLIRAGVISSIVLCTFAILGDAIFSQFVQADFASFQIFGGLIFLLIGIQFVFRGPKAIEMLRGESEHLAGSIAMPLIIGPGTISASVIIGKRLEPVNGCIAVVLSILITVVIMWLLKIVHDRIRPQRESLVQRYIEIAGRITALFVGTISIEMIMQGIHKWIVKF